MDKRMFFVLFAVILIAAFALRFYDLTNRPMHNDEGVIGWFKEGILNACLSPNFSNFDPIQFIRTCGASYSYNPDYHGPFEYLFGAWVFKLFGMSDFTLRAPECMFNFATILLLIPLRKKIGDIGTLLAASLLAVSPSMVYYAQRAYMDNFFIFFTLAVVVCAVKFWEERKNLWLYLGAASLALLFTTKETAFIFAFVAATFILFERIFQTANKGISLSRICERLSQDASSASKFIGENKRPLQISLLIFTIIYAFVFSTMFTNWYNVFLGITSGVTFWISRSTTWIGHIKPFEYYAGLLLNYEFAILALFLLSLPFALRSTFSRWCAWWSLSTFVIFSCIPYKTPWLDPHFLLPMAISAGAAFTPMLAYAKRIRFADLALTSVIIILLYNSISFAYHLTYVAYADANIPLVYVSGVDSYKQLVQKVIYVANQFNGTNTTISVISNEYWPLPWSLRDYHHAAWLGHSLSNQDAPIIISSKNDFSEIKEDLRSDYIMKGYDLRPWATVYLYYRT